MKIGDIVEIKPEYKEKNSIFRFIYVITNVNEKTKRCYIKPINSTLPIPGEELVSFDMIKAV